MGDCDFPGMHCTPVTEWDPTAYIAAGMIVIISVLLISKIAMMIRKK
jgi:hypothetical protein